jgi:hypothetical protein
MDGNMEDDQVESEIMYFLDSKGSWRHRLLSSEIEELNEKVFDLDQVERVLDKMIEEGSVFVEIDDYSGEDLFWLKYNWDR